MADSLIHYNCETGLFYWRVARGRAIKAGQLVKGTQRKDGYILISVGRTPYLAHRLAWLLVYGKLPEHQIDHVNGDKSDNRLSNLREATPSQNQWNKSKQTNNVSGYKGVSLHRQSGLYRARLKHHRREISVGYFNTADQAHEAVMAARAQLQGEFARC